MTEKKHIDIDLDFFGDDQSPTKKSVDSTTTTKEKSADHLNESLDFLDNNQASTNTNLQTEKVPKKYNWIKIFWTFVAILFFIGLLSSDSGSSSSSSSYTPTNSTYNNTNGSSDNSLVFDGQTFSCSDYHYDKAIALRPDAALSTQIDSEGAALDLRISSLDAEKARIDGMYVDEYSQWSIDNYNAAVDAYNVKKNRLQADIDSWNLKNTSFNRKIDAYNNYLDTNCRPQ